MTLPEVFGSSWDDLVENWCLGIPPVTSERDTVAALEVLARLCPDHVGTLVRGASRGLGVIVPAIESGRVLQACEAMPGFDKILPRLQRGDRSAFSEAQYAAALGRLGCAPELEPQVESAVLDTLVEWKGIRIYSEVISPERADAVVAADVDVQRLANLVRDRVPGFVVEVLLETDITPEIETAILNHLEALPLDQPVKIGGVATMVRRAASIPLQVGPTLLSEAPGPVLGAAAGVVGEGVATAGVVRMPIVDSRARRLLAAELHHFSRHTYNVLAIDMTTATVGPKDWASLIQRSFQPGQNRRIGAVVFFSRGLTGAPLASRQMWAGVRNEYAYYSIPPEFLSSLAGLDESAYFRGSPPGAPPNPIL
jgi:hypothetical protein